MQPAHRTGCDWVDVASGIPSGISRYHKPDPFKFALKLCVRKQILDATHLLGTHLFDVQILPPQGFSLDNRRRTGTGIPHFELQQSPARLRSWHRTQPLTFEGRRRGFAPENRYHNTPKILRSRFEYSDSTLLISFIPLAPFVVNRT